MGRPRKKRARKYGIRKAAPSYFAARPGKRRKLPSPTALPVTARMTPREEPQLSFFLEAMGRA
jgi:hypothetical protein